ncbi:UDP-N-acetylmuramoyl-tripeptide--D-alanyl-D-alanine ligase [Portibacter lacus]|uniref:UDP-N-acetylmuramoyl-tripeptide--D-alanyl-D-alanine ligase n=1 Tax=Portibacter lacus TaxID=1099794 RepID=A0AA37SRR5_9BACT|nr:UDP-N-acetylmuramoyl-tripeptide--D-alanyl-D-alanine ligase [Portibacter lacus]GLR19358.1 UDP-N-acetylmuramoyl-tripeptide--D-alanyl-D-alanine ligase [Portibacter lacus]
MKIEDLYKLFLKSEGVVTDSRKDLSNKIFFALKGENFNGNKYASQAISGGAKFSVIDEEEFREGENYILVSDVLLTLQRLASYHRSKMRCPILGITGSNGKTTNKELLGHALSKKYKCYFTRGNLNNHIGVPLSLLEITNTDEIAIIEMGANRMGDIAELCEIADPDYGYITNIGIAHLEGFKTRENILIEKGRLFEYVKKKRGAFYVNSSEKEIFKLAEKYEHSVLIGERVEDDYQFNLEHSIPNILFSERIGEKYESPLYGNHNYENLKMACGISQHLKVSISDIKQALSEYKPKNNRSEFIEKEGVFYFMDAYNANPSSMRSSLLSFARFDSDQKVLVLGDMLELGAESDYYHKELLKLISVSSWKDVVLIGEMFGKNAPLYSDYQYFYNIEDANPYINSLNTSGTYFLIKGSRGQALERLEIIQQLK